ncbi:MAG: hypothetical protein SOR83_12060 [Butyricicoccus pullicaecorum]|nr:hypothetical protein [Butyricicoccus pullicaecorum]
MEYFTTYNALKDKLDALLNDNHLRCKFDTHRYPITLTISPDASPEGQIALFETGSDKVSSRDASLKLTITLDGIEIQTKNRLVITDDLMNKIKSYAKKMHHEYLHGFYAEQTASNVLHFPEPDNAEADDTQTDDTTEPVEQEQPQPTDNDFAAFFDDDDSDQ